MCVRVLNVSKGPGGRITHIGGAEDNGQNRWGVTVAEAIAMIESLDWEFFVSRPEGDRVPVVVRETSGTKFLTTVKDDVPTNNLAELPTYNPPIAGTQPFFPLSIPGARRPTLRLVERRGNPPVPVNQAGGQYPVPGWDASHPLPVIFITCDAPWPADVEVFVDRDPTAPPGPDGQPTYVEARDKLQRLGFGPLSRDQLEQQGLGHWEYEIVIPRRPDGSFDPTYPRRYTPFRFTIRPPRAQRTSNGFTVLIRSVGYNPRCPGASSSMSVFLHRPSAVFSPPFTPPSGGPAGRPPTIRTYATGSFVEAQPTLRGAGQARTTSDGKKLTIRTAASIGLGGADLAAVFEDSTGKRLCQPVGFSTTTTLGGATFSPAPAPPDLGIVLSTGPGIGGNPGPEFRMRFAKLGAPSSTSIDVDCFLSKPNTSVPPRVLVSADAQVAILIDCNRPGASRGRARVLDLANRASSLGNELPFDGGQLSGQVVRRGDGRFVVRIQTSGGAVPEIVLPSTA